MFLDGLMFICLLLFYDHNYFVTIMESALSCFSRLGQFLLKFNDDFVESFKFAYIKRRNIPSS